MHFTPRLASSFRLVRKPQLRKAFLYGSGAIAVGGGVAVVRSVDSIEDLKEIGLIRFGRAVVTVGKIIVDYKTSLKGLDDLSEEYARKIKECHKRSAEHLLDLSHKNGGVFIKVGQHIAAMEYLVPPEYTDTLNVLMSKAPQASFEDVKFVIEDELGKPIEEIFDKFDKTPVGAASLAQVHPAYLKGTGEKVAVKVQHRRVLKNSRTDMNTMELLVNIADKLFPEFRLMWLVKEVKKNLPNELNFLHEAENADRVRKMFAHLPFLKIPKIIYDLSTPRVLTMEFCEGAQVDDVNYMKANNINRHDICKKMAKMISEMIFLAGYLHADPHAGNVLINKVNGQTQIVLLDHGLYLDMDEKFKRLYSELWIALLDANQERIKKVATQMGVGELYGLFACIVTRRSWKAVTEGINKSKIDKSEKEELRQYAVSLIPQISEVLSRMPREMLLILKTNDLLRNLEHQLNVFGRDDSLIEMSKCVIRSNYDTSLKASQSYINSFLVRVHYFWYYLQIRTYELFLISKDCLGLN
ncbi:unnamed protein product [Auanema sp. JU1783]|nr:unnamed protein product [Auanema sp. JU1783]